MMFQETGGNCIGPNHHYICIVDKCEASDVDDDDDTTVLSSWSTKIGRRPPTKRMIGPRCRSRFGQYQDVFHNTRRISTTLLNF
jgi:hypothetical protein